jgi:putative Mg2+ transporter-C (MgtC) family protein
MSAQYVTAFGEPTGQGWTQIAELGIALALSLLIGIEREAQQKAAGMRTYTLVGLGSALFVLVSKYGFTDVLGEHVTLDPSRVAAQIVSGLGFIGAGLIFVRRGSVRGLTTAASIWLVAAIGAAAAAGLPVLAAVVTAMYFLVLYGLRPVARWARRFRPDTVGMRITYRDGVGLLREIVAMTTAHGFAMVDLSTSSRHEQTDQDADPELSTVAVTVRLTGPGDLQALTIELSELDGVLGVHRVDSDTED